MKVSFLGGAQEVGGSCILLEVFNKNILLDCGIRQANSKDPLPNFRAIQEAGGVDAIIISHAHMDHIGTLPIISKEYPNAIIYTNNMTKDLMKVLLYDSLKIMNNREAEIPLYVDWDIQDMLNRVHTINYMVEYPMFENINLTFYMAGHIAGASCTYITTPDGSIFYSGDFSIFSQKTVDGLKVPKLRPDIAIFETTYGDKLHSNREIEEKRLIELIKQCETNKGRMLIPAFALGRAQEILLIIKKAINKKELKNIKVYVDGMIRDINKVYKLNPLYLKNSLGKKILKGIDPFYDENIIPVEGKEFRKKIIEGEESYVVVASSGMLKGGFSQCYASKISPLENGYIAITGYQDEESPGRKLLNLLSLEEDKKLELNGKVFPVNCKVERIGLSAHGDKGEIKCLINLLSPNNIFMVHGNEKTIEDFALELSSEVRGRVYAPKIGDSYEINIRNPRKQRKNQIIKVIDISEELTDKNIHILWRFILSNYEERLFTIEELIYIWNSNLKYSFSETDNFQKLIVESIYFESDCKRLFLFKARKKEEVEELKKIREFKPNEINDFIHGYFDKYEVKKASIICKEKKIVLNFDFPLVVSKNIYNDIKDFEKKIKWKVEINKSININAAAALICEKLCDTDIKKISYRLEQNKVIVILNNEYYLNKFIIDEFKNKTGLELKIQTPSNELQIKNNLNENLDNRMEQNKALNIIEESFIEEEFKPYKKAIKTNDLGKYIELHFITSIIGEKYREKIKTLIKDTGWNITISNTANQYEIIKLAIMLCNKKDIKLKKNPSFNWNDLNVNVKIDDVCANKVNVIKREFEYRTGCKLNFIKA